MTTPAPTAESAAQPTKGPWFVFNMVHEKHGRAMTPEEIGEYAKNNVLQSIKDGGSPDRFLFVCQAGNGVPDICLVGNGPDGPANAMLIADAGTVHAECGMGPRELLERVKELEARQDRMVTEQLKFAEDRDAQVATLTEALGKAGAQAKHVRDAATYKAWTDMLANFTQPQREHLARLLAHKWWISGLKLRQTEDGRDYSHEITGEAALKAGTP